MRFWDDLMAAWPKIKDEVPVIDRAKLALIYSTLKWLVQRAKIIHTCDIRIRCVCAKEQTEIICELGSLLE
jgi:hypothetical protein